MKLQKFSLLKYIGAGTVCFGLLVPLLSAQDADVGIGDSPSTVQESEEAVIDAVTGLALSSELEKNKNTGKADSQSEKPVNESCVSEQIQLSTVQESLAKNEIILNALHGVVSGQAESAPVSIVAMFNLRPEGKNIAILKESISSELKSLQNAPENLFAISESCVAAYDNLHLLEKQLQVSYRAILEQKLSFLELPRERRLDILEKDGSDVDDFVSRSEELQKSLQSSTEAQKNIAVEKEKAEKIADEVINEGDRILAEGIVSIESFRAKSISNSLEWLEQFKKILEKYDGIAKKITEAEFMLASADASSKSLSEAMSNSTLTEQFTIAKQQWRTLIDDGFTIYKMFTSANVKSAEVPTVASINLTTASPELVEKYETVLKKAKSEIDEANKLQFKKVEQHFDSFYRLLYRSSKVRSRLIADVEQSDLNIMEINDDYFNDLGREVLAIPFRFFGIVFEKYLDASHKMNNGIVGIWYLMQNLFFLGILLVIPFGARIGGKKLEEKLDEYRYSLIKDRSRRVANKVRLAMWVQRITPYSPWLLYSILLWMLQVQLEDSFLSELLIFLPIIKYLIAYKIFRRLIGDLLRTLNSIAQIEKDGTRELIESTSKVIGRFFFFSVTLLYLTKMTVEEGLLYGHVYSLMKVFGLILFGYASYNWRFFLAPTAKAILPARVGAFLAPRCTGKFALVFALPTFILIAVQLVFNLFWEWISELEFSKRFLAKLYRKKVESLVGRNEATVQKSPPAEYMDLFLGYDIPPAIIDAHEKPMKIISGEIDGWLNGTEEEQSLAIYGEKGVGKSTLFDRLSIKYSEHNVIRIAIPHKLTSKDALATYFAEAMGFDKQDSLKRGILEFNKSSDKKTIVLIDDAQNLFLGKYGGFDVINEFIDIVNLKTSNLFWCSSFNEYSWAYLKGVLGQAQYLRTEVHIGNWSDEKIRELIMSRHEQSDFKLSYDQIILASRSATGRADAMNEAEEQFFRLLWEQSNGNPKVALYLWVNCLHQQGSKSLRVNLPERPKTGTLGLLDDNTWFVLAAIAKHENLTRAEAVSITNLEWPIVARALKLGLETKYLHRSEGNRYRLHFTHQYDLIKQLKMKNFIYGIN